MKKKRYIGISVVILFLFALMFSRLSFFNDGIRDLPDIVKSGRILVLIDSSQVGLCRNGDSISGFQYELVKAFADQLEVELVVTEQNDFSECVNALQIGDYDIIARYFPITDEYKGNLLYTDPLFTSRQVLVQHLSTDTVRRKIIKNQLNLGNDTIYLAANSPYKMRLTHLSDEIAAPITLIELENKSSEQLVRLVSAGKIKQTVCDEQLATVLHQFIPNIDISLTVGFEQRYAWGVHVKSPLLQAKLNEFLHDFIATPEYWEIYRKYLEIKPKELSRKFSDSKQKKEKSASKKIQTEVKPSKTHK